MKSIDALIDGFKTFRHSCQTGELPDFQQLVEKGQSPRVMMIACVDSRVDPAVITRADAGDLLVVRNVANLVPPYRTDSHYQSTASAIEFAVDSLKVKHLVVMGHSRCGGILSLLGNVTEGTSPDHPLGEWMSVMRDVAEGVRAEHADKPLDDQACLCSRQAVRVSLNHLKDYPWVRKALAKDAVRLHGWYFNMSGPDLEALDPDTGTFHSLTES